VDSLIKSNGPELRELPRARSHDHSKPHRKYRDLLPLANDRLSNLPRANPSQIRGHHLP
jgi:hypothetical protein